METKKIYQILFPGLSYEMEPLMDAIWMSCGAICLLATVALIFQ